MRRLYWYTLGVPALLIAIACELTFVLLMSFVAQTFAEEMAIVMPEREES